MSSSQIEKRQYGEWEDLPTDLLPAIAKRLTSLADYSSFRCVCNSWRSAASFHNFDRQLPCLPLLVYFKGEEEKKISTNLLDLETNIRKCSNLVPPDRDQPYLSCSGWILQAPKDGDVHLTNIVWRTKINLPDWTTFPGPYSQKYNSFLPVIKKMVLSGSPTVNADVVIMVIWGVFDQLAFCRPGDKSWTIFPNREGFSDLIYHNGKLYAVDNKLKVVECDIHGPNPTKIVQVFAFPDHFLDNNVIGVFSRSHYYLVVVESSGKLLIVFRYIINYNKTIQFRIFEIELKDGRSFKEIKLGDRCLFLGLNSSICVEKSGELGNCIYFTNTIKSIRSDRTSLYDTGLCRYSDNGRRIEKFDPILGTTFFSPPIWILPTL